MKRYMENQTVGPLKQGELTHDVEVAAHHEIGPIGPEPIIMDASELQVATSADENQKEGLTLSTLISQDDPNLSPSRSSRRWKRRAQLGGGVSLNGFQKFSPVHTHK